MNHSLLLAHLLDDGLVIRGVAAALKHRALPLLAGLHGSPRLLAVEQELVVEGEILGNSVVQVLDDSRRNGSMAHATLLFMVAFGAEWLITGFLRHSHLQLRLSAAFGLMKVKSQILVKVVFY